MKNLILLLPLIYLSCGIDSLPKEDAEFNYKSSKNDFNDSDSEDIPYYEEYYPPKTGGGGGGRMIELPEPPDPWDRFIPPPPLPEPDPCIICNLGK